MPGVGYLALSPPPPYPNALDRCIGKSTNHQNISKEKLSLIKRTLLNDLRFLPTNTNIF